jgi:NTE family protein
MDDHWRAGHADAVRTLSHPEVLTRPTQAHGVEVYDFTTPRALGPAKASKEPVV